MPTILQQVALRGTMTNLSTTQHQRKVTRATAPYSLSLGQHLTAHGQYRSLLRSMLRWSRGGSHTQRTRGAGSPPPRTRTGRCAVHWQLPVVFKRTLSHAELESHRSIPASHGQVGWPSHVFKARWDVPPLNWDVPGQSPGTPRLPVHPSSPPRSCRTLATRRDQRPKSTPPFPAPIPIGPGSGVTSRRTRRDSAPRPGHQGLRGLGGLLAPPF